jgi:hypothetical protein
MASPACPAPMMTVSTVAYSTTISTGTPLVSTSYTADRARDCSTSARRVASGASPLTWNRHPDALVAVAHRLPDGLTEAEDAEQVDVTLHRGLHLGERDAPGGRDVGQPRGEARGDRVEQELDRRRCLARPTSTAGWSASYVKGSVREASSWPAPKKPWIDVRLWVPLTHRFVARNWNLASCGLARTASSVANSVGVSTPLSGGRAMAAVMSGSSVRHRAGREPDDHRCGDGPNATRATFPRPSLRRPRSAPGSRCLVLPRPTCTAPAARLAPRSPCSGCTVCHGVATTR